MPVGTTNRSRYGSSRGSPYPAYHFHGSQVATAGGVSTTFGNAVSAAGFIYETVDTRSDLWQLTQSPLAHSPNAQ